MYRFYMPFDSIYFNMYIQIVIIASRENGGGYRDLKKE
jgi:hypothetical protein